jgi:hypothetical protein
MVRHVGQGTQIQSATVGIGTGTAVSILMGVVARDYYLRNQRSVQRYGEDPSRDPRYDCLSRNGLDQNASAFQLMLDEFRTWKRGLTNAAVMRDVIARHGPH